MDKIKFKDTPLFSELTKGSKSFGNLNVEDMAKVDFKEFNDTFLLKVEPLESMSSKQMIDIFAGHKRETSRKRTAEEVKIAELKVAAEKQELMEEANTLKRKFSNQYKAFCMAHVNSGDAWKLFQIMKSVKKNADGSVEFGKSKSLTLDFKDGNKVINSFLYEIPELKGQSLRFKSTGTYTIVDTPENSSVEG